MGANCQLWTAGRAGRYPRNKVPLCSVSQQKKFGESWGSLKVPCQKKEERQEGTKQGEAAVGSRG